MSASQPDNYKVDYSSIVPKQIRSIAAVANASGRQKMLADILKKGIEQLQTNPTAWGDPYHHVSGGGILFCGILRPVIFQYVVFEEIRGVVLLRLRLFADFT